MALSGAASPKPLLCHMLVLLNKQSSCEEKDMHKDVGKGRWRLAEMEAEWILAPGFSEEALAGHAVNISSV